MDDGWMMDGCFPMASDYTALTSGESFSNEAEEMAIHQSQSTNAHSIQSHLWATSDPKPAVVNGTILLMLQKSQGQPPVGCIKPYEYWDIYYINWLAGFLPSTIVAFFAGKGCCWCFMADLFKVSDSTHIKHLCVGCFLVGKSPSCTDGGKTTKPTSVSHFGPWTTNLNFMWFLFKYVIPQKFKAWPLADWTTHQILWVRFTVFPYWNCFSSGHRGTVMFHLPRLTGICRFRKTIGMSTSTLW